MDILLENMPQTLPETLDPPSEISGYDPVDTVAAMFAAGMSLPKPTFTLDITDLQGVFDTSGLCVEVMHRYMASIDDDPALIGVPVAHALECLTTQYCSRNKGDPEHTAAVLEIQNCAQLLQEMLADQQTCINKRRKWDIKKNHRTEKVERAWAGLIKNKANLDEFRKGHPDTVYLEARKIFLPQGATLIVEYWQRELNAFVSELETVSISIPTGGRPWAFFDPTNTS